MPGLPSSKSFWSNWRDPSLGQRQFREPIFNICPRICSVGFRRSRQSNGRRASISPSGWLLRRRNRQTSPGFEIRELDSAGQERRAKERDGYYPVTYVEPLAGNEHIVGFDLFSETGRKTAVEETIETERVTATAPIRLVQEIGDQP